MKISLIIFPLIIKSLMGINAGSLENAQNNTNNFISCYQCSEVYALSGNHTNNTNKVIDMPEDCKRENAILKGNKDEFLCKLTVEPMQDQKHITIAVYSMVNKKDCINKNINDMTNIVCLDSPECDRFSLCCNEDLCNNNTNFGLKYLVHGQDKNTTIIDSYIKFSSHLCGVNKKRVTDTNPYCLIATNRDIYEYNRKIYELSVANKNKDGEAIILDDSADLEDNTNSDDSKEILIMNNKQKLDIPKKLVIRMKMWLKTIENDK